MDSTSITYAACPNCLKVNKISLSQAESHQTTCGSCHSPIDIQHGIVTVGTKQLQKMITASPLPVIADFWAPWCGPCRSFAPTFEQVAKEKAGKAVFVKVNTEDDGSASPTFGVRGIPTLISFKKGSEQARQSGALPYEYFKPWVEQQI